MKKTKIVCTMGPNTDLPGMLEGMVAGGMDVARFNFSHGDHAEHKRRMDRLKEVRAAQKLPVAILLDTKGPEIRTGVLKDGRKIQLQEGHEIVLTTEEVEGTEERVSVSYEGLPGDVKTGTTILVDDGLIELTVKSLTEKEIVCEIVNGGELGERKGVNVPNVRINLPAITEKDMADIRFGIEQGIDYVAASFVRKADDVRHIREFLNANGGEQIDIIAKIENAEGVENIDEIIQASEGVMVARGDLGVEIPAYQVPSIQKKIIEKCNHHYRPVITATQMLDSMIRNPRPTRAEVTDVANAVYDGTDAIMLSGETAMGKYPLEALQMMVQIAEESEHHLLFKAYRNKREKNGKNLVSSAVGFAAVEMVEHLDAACIVTPTMSGKTARIMSNLRPSVPIYAVTPNEAVKRKMQLYWGVKSVTGYLEDSTENIISHALYMIVREKLVKKGDMLIFTAGDPATNEVSSEGHATNMLHIIQAK